MRAAAEETLRSNSHLKIAQIVEWRSERLAVANEIQEGIFTREVVIHWMVNPYSEWSGAILSWFHSLQKHYKFSDVLLVDVVGRPRLSLTGRTAQLHDDALKAVESALNERRCVLTELHFGADRSPHMDAVTPLFSVRGEKVEPVGALIQQIDARQFLYPLVSSWPSSSRSAESMLVRRDGDDALFLNDLRHQEDAALKLRISLKRKEVPAVLAALGHQGTMEGFDYRGVEVLSVLQAVPDSSWFMVSKIDRAEVLADWRTHSFLIMILFLGLAVAMAAVMGMAWQHYAKEHYRSLFQSEVKLRKSEARYATTVMSIGDGLIATDSSGRVDLLNPVAEALTGWRQEEARGRPIQDVFRIIHQRTREPVENPVDRVLQKGYVVGLANQTVLLARDGKEHPIADSGAPIFNDEGVISGVVLVFRDQSEDLAVLTKLRESEEEYKNLYDEAPVGYVELDVEGRIGRVNEKMLEMLGYGAEEMLHRPLWEFVIEEKLAEETIKAKLMGRTPPSVALERTYRRKDGGTIPILIKDRAVRSSDGRITGIRVTIQDITLRKQAEEKLRKAKKELEWRVRERTAELERRNRELQDFVFIASHDLQEPLRKIRVFGGLLEEKSGLLLDQQGHDYVRRMSMAASRMQDLIGSLLTYSRLTSNSDTFQPVDLKDAVASALSNLEMCIQEKNGCVEVGSLPVVMADVNQMIQLFQNLVGNGLKYCRERPPHVKVYASEGENGACLVFVEDNGIGFDQKYAQKIFMPFQRLHDRSEFEGVGMGLAICRKIVERHHGTIMAKSSPERGSTFIVTLPLGKPE